MTVFSAEPAGQGTIYVGGVADALALDGGNNVDVVVDWKSDVEPTTAVVDLYREQVRDYLAATGGKKGLLVFVTSGRVERVVRAGSRERIDAHIDALTTLKTCGLAALISRKSGNRNSSGAGADLSPASHHGSR